MKFLTRLIEQMDNFKFHETLKLSDEIHEAESNGYELTRREDKYWLELTIMIENKK